MRLLQITDDDLAELTRDTAAICDELSEHMHERQRVRVRRIQKILMDVRWSYQPHTEHEVIPADEGEEWKA